MPYFNQLYLTSRYQTARLGYIPSVSKDINQQMGAEKLRKIIIFCGTIRDIVHAIHFLHCKNIITLGTLIPFYLGYVNENNTILALSGNFPHLTTNSSIQDNIVTYFEKESLYFRRKTKNNSYKYNYKYNITNLALYDYKQCFSSILSDLDRSQKIIENFYLLLKSIIDKFNNFYLYNKNLNNIVHDSDLALLSIIYEYNALEKAYATILPSITCIRTPAQNAFVNSICQTIYSNTIKYAHTIYDFICYLPGYEFYLPYGMQESGHLDLINSYIEYFNPSAFDLFCIMTYLLRFIHYLNLIEANKNYSHHLNAKIHFLSF